MSKKSKIKIIIFSILAVLVIGSTFLLNFTSQKKDNLLQQIAVLQEEISPLEFEISSKNDGEIKLRTVFYDLNGKKVGSQNIKVTGEELNFDFQVIKLAEDSFLFFPCGIYTEQIALADSVKVFDAYNNGGFPEIYNGIENEKLNLYFQLTMDGKKDFDADVHGIAVHDIKNISQFKKGFVYKVICHPHTGAIEIIRK